MMSTVSRSWPAAAALLAAVVAPAGRSFERTCRAADAPRADVSTVAPAPAPAPTPAPTSNPEDRIHHLQLRSTEARLRVAELDLERAIAANERFHDAVGDREIQRLRNHVAMLRRQVDIAREHPRTAARQVCIAAAEAACADARGDLEAAERATQRTPGSVSDINVERLRAKVELADIRLELCRNPDYELSLLAELEWNIEQLTDEVVDLRYKVEAGASRDPGASR